MSRATSVHAAAAAVRVRRNTTLFVDGLPESFASGDLTALFAQYGQVVEGEVFVDDGNVSRGFGFVTMYGTDAAARAKAALDLKTLPGASPARPLKVRWALDRATLFVGDLGPDVTGDQLQEARARSRPAPAASARPAPAASSRPAPAARARACVRADTQHASVACRAAPRRSSSSRPEPAVPASSSRAEPAAPASRSRPEPAARVRAFGHPARSLCGAQAFQQFGDVVSCRLERQPRERGGPSKG